MRSYLKKNSLLLSSFCILLLAGVVWYFVTFMAKEPVRTVPENARYLDSSAPIEERVADLLSYMTLEEKIGQMALVEKNSVHELRDIKTYGLGGMLSGFGGKPEDNTPLGWKQMIESYLTVSKSTRLGIPLLYGIDAIHGHSNVPGATVFPHFIGLGATTDAALVRSIAAATAEELRASNIRWSYSPTYDMPTDIRWGRTYEAFSDDPELVSELASAYIEGLQQTTSSATSAIFVLATPKHYIAAGSMRWNTSSNKNFKIDQGTTPVDEEELRSRHLPPFIEAIEDGALSIMVGLNSWGDTKLAASSYLIQDILKDEHGFQGFVVSDWYGVYEIPGSNYRAAVTAINAGVDMVMLPFEYQEFTRNVRRAVRNGDIAEARIDDAVTRILRAKFSAGLFDDPKAAPLSVIGSPEHRALARTAVARSLVLLKNDHSLLPLRSRNLTVRVAGSAADNVGKQSGAWTVEWQGIDGNWLPGATSILTGLREVAPEGTTIEFNEAADFATSGPKADIGIAIVGEDPYAEGWGDTEEPSLSPEDIATINKLREVSEAVVVILVTGRPIIITPELSNWNALVVAWLPGSEGAGVADVLFGRQPFSGKLPMPWPRSTTQLPIVGELTSDNTSPLFPRYFGL